MATFCCKECGNDVPCFLIAVNGNRTPNQCPYSMDAGEADWEVVD